MFQDEFRIFKGGIVMYAAQGHEFAIENFVPLLIKDIEGYPHAIEGHCRGMDIVEILGDLAGLGIVRCCVQAHALHETGGSQPRHIVEAIEWRDTIPDCLDVVIVNICGVRNVIPVGHLYISVISDHNYTLPEIVINARGKRSFSPYRIFFMACMHFLHGISLNHILVIPPLSP